MKFDIFIAIYAEAYSKSKQFLYAFINNAQKIAPEIELNICTNAEYCATPNERTLYLMGFKKKKKKYYFRK